MASGVWSNSVMIHIRLLDGREISVPLEWFPQRSLSPGDFSGVPQEILSGFDRR
jgi:hypothetical protein